MGDNQLSTVRWNEKGFRASVTEQSIRGPRVYHTVVTSKTSNYVQGRDMGSDSEEGAIGWIGGNKEFEIDACS